MDEISRRRVMRTAAACLAGGVAGCSGVLGTDSDADGAAESRPVTTGTDGPSRAELRARVTDLRDRLAQLNGTVEAKDGRIAELNASLREMEGALESRTESVESLQARLSEREARIDELESSVETLEARIDELEARSTPSDGSGEFADSVLETARATARDARQSVVKIRFENGHGTGWVLDADAGHVVTNAHVLRGVPDPTVETVDGRTVDGERIAYDEDLLPDVGLLRADLDVPALPTGDRSALESSDPLLTVGHPAVAGDWVATMGRYERYDSGLDWVLSTVPTSNGNSGGPLLTLGGEVVGLISGTTRVDDGGDHSKSDEVYAEMPKPSEFATATPVETVLDRVSDWT